LKKAKGWLGHSEAVPQPPFCKHPFFNGLISNAANSIDSMLRVDPLDAGESRVVNIRILTVPPLSVYYDVHEDDRLVTIWAVWQRSAR